MARKKIVEIVLDVETTGLDFTKERIVEFAAIRLENGCETGRFETLINPMQHIRKSSVKIHGITQEMVEDAPKEEEVIDSILDFIGDYPIVAHNAVFDYSFLNEASLRCRNKKLENHRIDSQFLFKEVFPDEEAPNLENLGKRFNVESKNRHRAMGDAEVLAKVFPKLKKLYEKKYDWQLKQIKNIEYLFERYLRIQNTVATLQSELNDLKSIFKVYFEKNKEPIVASNGDILTYNCKHSFGYDFEKIKESLEEIGVLNKAVKLNNNFVDRLVCSLSINDELKDKIKDARSEISETKHLQIIKSEKNKQSQVQENDNNN